MANKMLQEIKGYTKYCDSGSTEGFKSTLFIPVSSSTTSVSSNSNENKSGTAINIPSTPTMSIKGVINQKSGTSLKLEGQYLKSESSIVITVGDKFICKHSQLEAPEIYLPAESLISNEGCVFSGNMHYDDYI